jgi:hypothetical protein
VRQVSFVPFVVDAFVCRASAPEGPARLSLQDEVIGTVCVLSVYYGTLVP